MTMLGLVFSMALIGSGADGGFSSADIEAQIAAARKARSVCGPVCVWFCLRRLGQEADLATVVEQAEMESRGIRLDRLLSLAQSFGLPARAVVFDPKQLEAVPQPAILVIGQSHCVVLGAVDPAQGKARIFEPATGRVGDESMTRLTERWSGEAIIFADPPMPWLRFSWLLALAASCTVAGL